MKKIKESVIQKSIKERLEWNGCLVWKHSNVGIFKKDTGRYIPVGRLGVNDLFALKDGVLYGIEVKSSVGKQSENQREWQRELEKHGGIYILARSIEDVALVISEHQKIRRKIGNYTP